MKLKHISNTVEAAIRLEEKCIFREETGVNDAATIIFSLEVRIREAYKNFLERCFGKILAEVAHCVGTHNRNIVEFSGFLYPTAPDLLSYEVHQLVPNFHPED